MTYTITVVCVLLLYVCALFMLCARIYEHALAYAKSKNTLLFVCNSKKTLLSVFSHFIQLMGVWCIAVCVQYSVYGIPISYGYGISQYVSTNYINTDAMEIDEHGRICPVEGTSRYYSLYNENDAKYTRCLFFHVLLLFINC